MNEDVRKRLQNNIKKLKFLKVEQKNIGILERDLNYPDIHKVEIREKGWEEILPYNYAQSYGAYTFKTLFLKKEIVDCLKKIKEECNEIWNSNTIFNFDIKKPLRLQEFKSKQKANINIIGKKLDEWVKIIKDTLEKFLTGVGKGSFNINIASKEIYDYLKLKIIWL